MVLSIILWLRQLQLDDVRKTIQTGLDQFDRSESSSGSRSMRDEVMIANLKPFQARLVCAVVLGRGSFFSLNAAADLSAIARSATAEDRVDTAPAKTSIPWSQLGAKAGADYKADGLAVIPASDGAWLRCVFQRLEGEVTREGLRLTSTIEASQPGRFRVMPTALGRANRSEARL